MALWVMALRTVVLAAGLLARSGGSGGHCGRREEGFLSLVACRGQHSAGTLRSRGRRGRLVWGSGGGWRELEGWWALGSGRPWCLAGREGDRGVDNKGFEQTP